MKKKEDIAYNLADIAFYYDINEAYVKHMRDTGCGRFYFGSYFCPKYCMRSAFTLTQQMRALLEKDDFRVTFVCPSGGERDSAMAKQCLSSVLENGGGLVDEVVINDYGMLSYAAQCAEYYPLKVTAGRLMSKNFRDPRYPDYQERGSGIHGSPILYERVSAVEIDICTSYIDLTDLPEDKEVHVHYPYYCVSGGPHCIFKASRYPGGQGFLGGPGCGFSCMNAYIETKDAGAKFLQIGKGVYAEGKCLYDGSRDADRYIYWPVKQWILGSGEGQEPSADASAER